MFCPWFRVKVAAGEAREYGMALVSKITANRDASCPLLSKLPEEFKVWMSHGDKLHSVPEVSDMLRAAPVDPSGPVHECLLVWVRETSVPSGETSP